MDRLVAIGDIHGCVHTLKDLLNRVSYSSQTDTLVFIGDYIDRGYFSYEVVSMLIKLQHQIGKDKVVCLRGNHEQMAIDAYRHGNYPLWDRNGGHSTEYSFEKTARILLTQFHGLRHCHLFTTPQRLFSVMPACPIPYCKITARKIFCGDAIGFKQIQKNEKSKLYLDTHQGLTEEPTQSQQETYVLMLGVYTMAAYVRSSSKTTNKAPVCM